MLHCFWGVSMAGVWHPRPAVLLSTTYRTQSLSLSLFLLACWRSFGASRPVRGSPLVSDQSSAVPPHAIKPATNFSTPQMSHVGHLAGVMSLSLPMALSLSASCSCLGFVPKVSTSGSPLSK